MNSKISMESFATCVPKKSIQEGLIVFCICFIDLYFELNFFNFLKHWIHMKSCIFRIIIEKKNLISV